MKNTCEWRDCAIFPNYYSVSSDGRVFSKRIGCVKGGMGYWNKIREDFPEVFQARAKLEREIGRSCIRGVFLDELDPAAGRMSKPVLEDCSILCQITANELEGEE